MLSGGVKVVTAAQMRAMDAFAIERIGIPGVVLMENAGRAVADAIEEHFKSESSMTVAIFCGKGNNGGDGYVVARHLANRGHEVIIFALAAPSELVGDARTNADIVMAMGLEIRLVPDRSALSELLFDARDFDLVVDALFGTGLTSAVRGHAVGVIDLINSSGLPVVAVDIPSGLNADSGLLPGPAVEADLTVTFAYPKIGLIMAPAAHHAGEVIVADISIPVTAEGDDLTTCLMSEEMVGNLRLERDPDSHKGTYGHAFAVAGATGTCGAAAMVGAGALRAGAGLVTLGVAASLVPTVEGLNLETMTVPLAEEAGYLAEAGFDSILGQLTGKTSFALGPGIGTRPGTVALVHRLVRAVEVPMVLDADAINAFAGRAGELRTDGGELVITPHPGEMARLLGLSTTEVQADRIGVARKLAVDNGIIVVLKGHRTIVADRTGEVYINLTGNPGMATAGAGDVLTGMIAGLLGMSDLTPLEAAIAGVWLHGFAGDLAAEKVGYNALTASDILAHIVEAFRAFEEVD